MKVFLFVILSTTSVWSFADVCGTVIDGASLQGYQSDYGGYDADGRCHIRNISGSTCRNLPGFYDYSEDHGKGFSHCVFAAPSGNTRGRSSSGSSDTTFYNNMCERQSQFFIDGMKKLQNMEPDTEDVRIILGSPKRQINDYCPQAARRNVVTWAEGKYNEWMAYAEKVEARKSAPTYSAPSTSTETTTTTSTRTCNNVPSDTAWCRSDAQPNGLQNNCFGTPSKTGDDNFTVKLSMFCRQDSYMATFATYDDSGNCTRQVVQLSRDGHYDGQIISSTSYSKKPHILDSIVSSSSDLVSCYMQRHNGCSCD